MDVHGCTKSCEDVWRCVLPVVAGVMKERKKTEALFG